MPTLKKRKNLYISPKHLTIDFNALTFLAENKKPQVFQEVLIAEKAFYSAMDAIGVRNQWIEEHIIPNLYKFTLKKKKHKKI